MANSDRSERKGANLFQDWVNAMSNQYGEVDVRLEDISVKLPFIPEAVRLNGTVTLSFHLRELSAKEKDARVAKEVRLLHA
ncbi:MAG: hypothetical protein L3K10_06370 [Thermoplasmata archaeon]|nr:hypothetical protein [Thermoplasmata archaeon]